MNSKKKICVVTGTRAEFGLLYWLIKGIQDDADLDLQLIVTGMHLSPEFGLTYREIEKSGFAIDNKVEMLLSGDTPSSISKSTGLGIIGFADAYNKLNPDLVIVLGDRFEIFAAGIAALFAKIPIAHIHGGETTEGAYDEAIRHSISKMAWWHFVAAEEYKRRVIQLGEQPERVFNVGGLGVDTINKVSLLSKDELADKFKIRFADKNLLVTFHPVTLENQTSKSQCQSLLNVLSELVEVNLIFTMPNADSNGRIIKEMLYDFVDNNKERSICFKSMGHINYLSTLQFVDGVIGNSSSGIAEAPSFKIGTINIGDRQKGRLKADSVIDCKPTEDSIKAAIEKLYENDFQKKLKDINNPYGEGMATEKILDILANNPIPSEPKKEFYNL